MKKHLLLLFTALLPLVASAQTKVEIDGIWYNLITKTKQAEVTYKGNDALDNEYSGSITIPDTVSYEGVKYGVTSIGKSAFAYCSRLTAINIPESVTSIGGSAFWNCSKLTAINIPESVTSIGETVFAHCSNLTAITVAEGNTNYYSPDGHNAIVEVNNNTLIVGCSTTIIPEGVISIGDYAFAYCRHLTAITIPESVTNIGNHAFSGCSSLTAITIPESMTSIEAYTFSDCSSLTAITIPESVTSIGKSAFAYCSSLAAIIIPEGVTSIESGVFSGCSSLTAITIPESVTSIGLNAFSNCSRLTAINIPKNVMSIGINAFSNCSSLITINIPKNVTSIERYAFEGCSSLTSITIPESVTNIENYTFHKCKSLAAIVLPKSIETISLKAFAGCPELLDVYSYAKNVPYAESNTFEGSLPEYATLHVPDSMINAYRTTFPWSNFGTIVALGATITRITLDKSSVALTEGEAFTLTITTSANADRNLISWSSSNPSIATIDNTGKVTAVAPGTATITVNANDGSGVSASCEVTVKEKLLGKCTAPVINYVAGKVVLACDTEEATIISVTNETTERTEGECESIEFALIPTYTITAYATKENYEDSDVTTLTICWIPCSEEHHSEETDVLTIPSKPVLINARDGVLTLCGLEESTVVTLYTTDGTLVAQQQSSAGEAKFTVDTNQVYIVHIDDKVVKIGL